MMEGCITKKRGTVCERKRLGREVEGSKRWNRLQKCIKYKTD